MTHSVIQSSGLMNPSQFTGVISRDLSFSENIVFSFHCHQETGSFKSSLRTVELFRLLARIKVLQFISRVPHVVRLSRILDIQ